MSKKTTSEIRLLTPQRAPLTPAQEREAVTLLADLLLDVSDALTKATAEAETRRPELEQRLASISAEITRAEHALERYYEAFEQGTLSAERCETTTDAPPSAPR